MAAFILGCIFYLISLSFVFYWVFIKDAEDYFYQSLFCISGMSVLALLTLFWGEKIFSAAIVKWVSIAAASVAILFSVIFFISFIFSSINVFEARLVLFLVPILISSYVIICATFQDELMTIIMDVIPALIGGVCAVFAILTEVRRKRNEKDLNEKLRGLERDLRYSYFDVNSFSRNRYSKREMFSIEQGLSELYMKLQKGKVSTSKAIDILHNAEIPTELIHRIMERLFVDDFISKSPVLNLPDFLQELLPEVFTARRAYHSSSVDIRYYEDLYEKIRYSMSADNSRIMDELTQKIDSLNSYIQKNLQSDTRNAAASETYGSQNQIRELFHALETPIATSEMALATLKASFDTLTERQEGKFERIQNTMKLIKSILFAYRELTVMNIYSDENTFFSLPEIINSIPSLMSTEKMDAKLELKDIPDHIPKYSTNLIVVLLLPLIHNAIEASPAQKPVLVECQETENVCAVKIENYCKQTPRQANLDTEGYSSKGNNHVGTGISIVRRISKSVGVDFVLKVNNNKVSAMLSFPKQ